MSTPNKYTPPNNTKVLLAAGYKFQPDTYRPTIYRKFGDGWVKLKENK